MNILKKANEIVFERSEEREREYGDFIPCMEKAARIASEMSGKDITTEMVYYAIIGIKFARESHKHKEDSLLDIVAYLGSLNEYLESKK